MTFNVLRPTYLQNGLFYIVKWEQIGEATSMEDAKRKFGGCPVLEVKRD